MEHVKLSEFSINKRMVAKIWGDVQKQNKTNDKRVTSFQCSRHGGYVLDPKDFSSSELESLGNYGKGTNKIKLAILIEKTTGEEYVCGVIYPHMFSKQVKFDAYRFVFKEWKSIPVITFEEDIEWAILYRKLGIISKSVSETVLKSELDRCSNSIMENNFKELI